MKKRAKIFISGGSGFVGSHLCKYMTRKGIDILTTEDAGGKSGSKLDITDLPKLLAIPHEVEAVIHLAAKTSVGDSFRYAHDTYHTNLLGTLNLLEFAVEKKVGKFINMSTYLYGQPKYLPVDEKHPIDPYSPYNKSKLLAEQLCQFYARDFGIDIITLRPFYLYGSCSRVGSFIQSALEQINKKGSVILSGRATRRDFLFVDDFVHLVDIILSEFPRGYNVYNVGYGKSYLLTEVSEILARLLHKKISIKFDDRMRPGDVTEMIADISKISSEFKWKPSVSLQSGLEYTVKQYLSPSHT